MDMWRDKRKDKLKESWGWKYLYYKNGILRLKVPNRIKIYQAMIKVTVYQDDLSAIN